MAVFNPNHQVILDQVLLANPLVRSGKMFGLPAYYVGKKLSICLYENGVGVKLPAEAVQRLLDTDENTVPFQPLGRPRMKEWVQINLEDSEGYRGYREVFEESIDFVWSRQQEDIG